MKKALLFCAVCLTLSLATVPALAATTTGFTENAAILQNTNMAHALVQGLGVMTGDQNGNLNWSKTVTRAEAATMLVRLVGGEDEAQALKDKPTPFSDVPTWATGYVNYAYEQKLVQGAGEGLFQPDRTCTAGEFLTMLYRLTDLKEGTDYNWDTAVTDFTTDVMLTPVYGATYQYSQIAGNYSTAVLTEDFTRDLAASSIFRMMNIVAGENNISLADKLAYEYGLSSTVFHDCSVRRTGWELNQEGRYSTALGPLNSVVFQLKDGKLYLEEPSGVELEFFVDSEVSDRRSISVGQPFTLPTSNCQLTLSYYEAKASFYHSCFLFIRWVDGKATFSMGPGTGIAYDLYYAIKEDGFHLRAKAYGVSWDTTTAEDTTDEMRSLAASLTKGKTTERAKAKAIADWVSEHIYYDYDQYLGKRNISEDTLTSRLGVCADYSVLTRQLMTAAGLECYIEDSADHAWNVAFLDGEWVLMDTTWDSPLLYHDGEYLAQDHSQPAREGVSPQFSGSFPVSNMLEPNAQSKEWYFGMGSGNFYQGTHTPNRTPSIYTFP